MRNLLFLLLLCLSFASLAQSGSSQPGPTATDDNMKMEFVTYAQGFIVLAITNKTSCALTVSFHWESAGKKKDSTIVYAANALQQTMLPFAGGSVAVQAKTVKGCNQQSNGPWLTLSLISLSLREIMQPRKPDVRILPGMVRVVAVDGSDWKEMSETKFKADRCRYRWHYFILRAGKPKEIVL